ncbi:restriction endonuclease [Demequina sp. TTPB684]|uniref:restriction endonuclease n=1 Tax=unclassified Demequina TaxID=2620311 RepID=UPI001CF46F91|nr:MULTISPECIES: restriction endonuclease [unclassified Demequina]MCB2412391.1 restriction endonuclease [Demequina sp. TTPB684]UPU89525.1 restriction endonuclease [Demequina sp. TMPB413]
MGLLTLDELESLFAQEGSLVGSCWYDYDPVMPGALVAHRQVFLDEVATLLVDQDASEIESLIAEYDRAVEGNRAVFGQGASTEQLDTHLVQARIREATADVADTTDAADDRWFQPSLAVRRFVDRVSDGGAAATTEDELKCLYADIGRLGVPLAPSGFPTELPERILRSIDDLTHSLSVLLHSNTAFDVRLSQFRPLWSIDLAAACGERLRQSATVTQPKYLAAKALGAPLPDGLAERAVEIERRATVQAHATHRAAAAIAILIDPIVEAANTLVDDANQEIAEAEAQEAAERRQLRAEVGFPHPGVHAYGVSPRGAELWVRDFLRHLGAVEAEATQQTDDGGVDVVCDDFLVSVKHYAHFVPVEEVREIFAVAAVDGKAAVLWTSGTLTAAGSEFADVAPVAVVQYNVETGQVVGLNVAGTQHLEAVRGEGQARC